MSINFDNSCFLSNWLERRSEYSGANIISFSDRHMNHLKEENKIPKVANDNDHYDLKRRG